jgi:methionyl-tRNA formyltransferase
LAARYPRRTPNDSRVNPEQSIRSQFDLIRVCDPDRYPAFFELYGHKYIIRVEKSSD